jgi:hypothetical protein
MMAWYVSMATQPRRRSSSHLSHLDVLVPCLGEWCQLLDGSRSFDFILHRALLPFLLCVSISTRSDKVQRTSPLRRLYTSTLTCAVSKSILCFSSMSVHHLRVSLLAVAYPLPLESLPFGSVLTALPTPGLPFLINSGLGTPPTPIPQAFPAPPYRVPLPPRPPNTVFPLPTPRPAPIVFVSIPLAFHLATRSSDLSLSEALRSCELEVF